ncbi:MAG: phage protein Gp37 [Pseudomonadota bacterium]
MIGEIENAIIARLEGASPGYKLHVATYGGELDDIETLGTVVPKFPAALVVMKGIGRPQPSAGGRIVPVTWTVFACAQNRRNERASRHGARTGAEVGSYQLVTDIRALLKDSRLGLEIGPMVPGLVSSLFNGKLKAALISVYACDFTCTFFEDDVAAEDAAAGDLSDFLTLRAYWDLPPHGNVQPPLPPQEADATDIITVRSE